MNTVFIIGNGLSREGYDLESLRGRGHIIGCNWLYKDFIPDTLTMIDSPPQDKVRRLYGRKPPFNTLTKNVQRTHLLLNREIIVSIGEIGGPFWNNSGVMSTWYACEILKADRIVLIGVDFFRPTERYKDGKRVNDIYGIYTHGISIQGCFSKIVDLWPDIEFIRVGPVPDSDKEFYAKQVHPRIRLQETYDD